MRVPYKEDIYDNKKDDFENKEDIYENIEDAFENKEDFSYFFTEEKRSINYNFT